MFYVIFSIFIQKRPMNPFTLRYNPEYFCDREDELIYLKNNALNGLNTLIHSPRRLGKSALILHLFNHLEEEKSFECIYVDLFASQNIKDLTKSFGEVLLKKYHTKNLLFGVKKLFKGLFVSVSFSSDGSPQLNLGIDETQVETSLNQLFEYLEHRKKIVIIAFDEFQEVASYPEKAEAILRTITQRLRNVFFIYSGSSNHILQNMFYSAKQAFYQSSESLVIGKIEKYQYAEFILNCFKSSHKKITTEAINHLLEFSETHTYYTQVICNQAYYKSEKLLELEEAQEITNTYIETRKHDYLSILNLLPDNQKKLIAAIAKEGVISKPSSVEFLIKYKLPSSSSTLQALYALVEKEMIYKTGLGYKIYDVFFRRFLEKYF